MNFNLINPIPEVIKDSQQLTQLLEKYSIIPYYGGDSGTSHSMLDVLRDLSELSTSHASCKNDIKAWAFRSGLNVVKKNIPGLYIPKREPVDPGLVSKYSENLNKFGINFLQIIENSERLFSSIRDSGNAYLHIKVVKVNGTVKIFLNTLDFEDTAYLQPKTGAEIKTLVNTPYWDEEYWKKNPPNLYTVSYPGKSYNFREKSNTFETVVHLKNPSNYYYGRPQILSVLNAMFSEFANFDLLAKISGTEFVSKTILAFQEVDPARKFPKGESAESLFARRITRLRGITTNEGGVSAKSLAAIEYPFGGEAPTQIKLDINRDTQYSEWSVDVASSVIYENHSWSKELTGRVNTKAGIGASILGDLFKLKNTSTIMPVQKTMQYFWVDVLNNLAPWIGESDLTIEFPDIISPLYADPLAIS